MERQSAIRHSLKSFKFPTEVFARKKCPFLLRSSSSHQLHLLGTYFTHYFIPRFKEKFIMPDITTPTTNSAVAGSPQGSPIQKPSMVSQNPTWICDHCGVNVGKLSIRKMSFDEASENYEIEGDSQCKHLECSLRYSGCDHAQ